MAGENFTFEIDHRRHFMRITLQGHWACETVDRYREAARRAVQAMMLEGYPLEDAVLLVDTRALPVQAREVADYYGQTPIAATRPRKVATLAASRLVGMQVRRVGMAIDEIFEDEIEALAWLFDGVEPAPGHIDRN